MSANDTFVVLLLFTVIVIYLWAGVAARRRECRRDGHQWEWDMTGLECRHCGMRH